MISITCVIPVYNVENYILDCLESVANQSYTGPVECLLIDDCGTDGSIDKAKEFISNYRGDYIFRIISHNRNKGLSGARNTGLLNAVGEYIYFLDSDDRLAEDCFKLLTNPLKKESYDVIVGNFEVVPQQTYHTKLKFTENTVLKGRHIIEQYGKFNIYMMAWNKLCRRTFLLENECFFYEGILHEDELWSYNLSVCARSMFIVGQSTYIYNIREGSIMSSSKSERRKKDLATVCKEIMRIADNNGLRYNYYSNRCLQNVILKNVALGKNENDSYLSYTSIRKYLGCKRFDSLFANGVRLKSQLYDIHWLLPCNLAYILYKKINHLKF